MTLHQALNTAERLMRTSRGRLWSVYQNGEQWYFCTNTTQIPRGKHRFPLFAFIQYAQRAIRPQAF